MDNKQRKTLDLVLSVLTDSYRHLNRSNRDEFISVIYDNIKLKHIKNNTSFANNSMLVNILRFFEVDVVIIASNKKISHIYRSNDIKIYKKNPKDDIKLTRDVLSLDKQFKKSKQDNDRHYRFLAFMRTGIRSELNIDKNINKTLYNENINKQRELGFTKKWKNLGAWHRKIVIGNYLSSICKYDEHDELHKKNINEAIRAVSDSTNNLIMKIDEPDYDNVQCKIRSLFFSSELSGINSIKKKKVHNRVYKNNINNLITKLNKDRLYKKNEENKSIIFNGSFVCVN